MDVLHYLAQKAPNPAFRALLPTSPVRQPELQGPLQESARPEPQALEARPTANFLDHSLLIHPFPNSLR
jgi:hypothetical protein